jgi:hypothetical protein
MLRRFDEDEESFVEEEELPPNSFDDDEPETGGMSKEELEEEGERNSFYEREHLIGIHCFIESQPLTVPTESSHSTIPV